MYAFSRKRKTKQDCITLIITFCLFLLLPGIALAATTTLGNTSSGDAGEGLGADFRGNVFLATENFIGETIYINLSGVAQPPPLCMIFAAIYSVNFATNEPENLLGQTDGIQAFPGWNSIDLQATVNIVAGQKYFICFDVTYTSGVMYSLTSGIRWSQAGGSPVFPDPFGVPTAGPNNTLCIYLEGTLVTGTPTYTEIPTVTHTPTITLSSTLSPTSTFTPTYTITLTSTPTYTSIPTHTSTVSPTYTPTYTITPTPTYTTTPTKTISATNTPFFTITPTYTITTTITLTATRTSTVSPTPTSIVEPFKVKPGEVMCYPAPANGNDIWFYYTTQGTAHIEIEIFNILGEKGTRLTSTHATTGYHRTYWDISAVAPGIYLYRVNIQDNTGKKTIGIKKLVIVK